ncbi:AAA family ATPase [Alcaligenes nematophilus]|uniref:AAA family ATPase n=1 Tax=Alcaligenes nematophilus TaxID=2994643 RepID=UPI0035B5057C
MAGLAKEEIYKDTFEKWLSERSRWLQTAAARLIEKKSLPDALELSDLIRLCKAEAAKQPDKGFTRVAPGSFSAAIVRPVVRIDGLSEVFGVNAIKPGASLQFGPDSLTIIYGQNGSGKSGYARLIKQLCGSRSKDDIRPNVFSDEQQPCRAKCNITVDGVSHEIDWQPNSALHPHLRKAQVFDSKAASQYMGRTESSYEPSSMRFISRLIEISDQVSTAITSEKSKLVSSLPQFPIDLADTDEKLWLSSLKPAVTEENINKFCFFTKELDEERIKTEGLLSEKDVAGRLAAIKKERISADNAKQLIQSLKVGLSDEITNALHKSKTDADSKRNAANIAAQQLFANSPLEGVGEEAWRLMWDQAKNYSVARAYPGIKFPATSDAARCVLCQQTLDEDAASRLQSFESFVTAGLETAAKAAEKYHVELLAKVVQLPSAEDWIAKLAQFDFNEEIARSLYTTLENRRARIANSTPVIELENIDWNTIDAAMEKRFTSLLNEETSLNQLQQDGKRKALEIRLKKLKAIQWLSENKAAIILERQRLVTIDLLDKAARLAATNSLTSKRNELAKTELDAGYQIRFTEELKALGGSRLPVAPQSKAQGKGVITFGLTLVGAKDKHAPDIVLSEGEARIVALAAFLADTTGSNQQAPFIFDDPISSLDQDFEERVVARLMELAKTRQVIIFTHRLSLIALIEAAIKKQEDLKHTVLSLRRLDKVSGILARHNLRDAKPDKAVNVIHKEIIPQLKKFQDEADADNYDLTVKSACSDFRIVLERTIEYILLNDVISRFRRDVMTKGKLHGVAKVKVEDCDYFDQLMSTYSVYEHSQADELPQVPVELAVFERDVTQLLAWMAEFKARAS